MSSLFATPTPTRLLPLLLLLFLLHAPPASPAPRTSPGEIQFVHKDPGPMARMASPAAAEDSAVTFELNALVPEELTKMATPSYPYRLNTKVTARTISGGVETNEELTFAITFVDPAAEASRFTLRKVGLNEAFVQTTRPFDRERLAEQYPDKVNARGEAEIVLDIQASPADPTSTTKQQRIRYTVAVEDSNDNAPVFVEGALEVGLDENREPNSVNPLMNVRANDADFDRNSHVSYKRLSVTSVDVNGREEQKIDPGSWFLVDSGNGNINVMKQVDREETALFRIVVAATDDGRPTRESTATVTVVVKDVNDNPPVCASKEVVCGAREDVAPGTPLDPCDLGCTDADDQQSTANVVDMAAAEGGTCPFGVKEGRVVTTGPLDRETEKRHTCVVTVRDPGKPEFAASTRLIVDVGDVNDNFPRPQEPRQTMQRNEANATLDIVFVDEDEGDVSYVITMTSGADYFKIENNAARRRRRAAAAPLSLRADDATLKLRQTQEMPPDFPGLEFRGCDDANVCGESKLVLAFPGSYVAAGGAFPWWIIIIVVLVLLILIVVAVVFMRRRKQKQEAAAKARGAGANGKDADGVEGHENLPAPEKIPLLVVENGSYEGQKPKVENELVAKKADVGDADLESTPMLKPDGDAEKDAGKGVGVQAGVVAPFKPREPEDLKEDKDPNANDEMLTFDLEGTDSKAGSLSSLESIADEDEDYTNVYRWGPRFGRLAKMLGEEEERVFEESADEEEEIEDNFMPTQEEDAYYLRCFKACDPNNTGHVTASELQNALQWMDGNPFGDRKARKVDKLYVEGLLKKYNIDDDKNDFTFELPEFINLMRGEKIVFAQKLFVDADKKGEKRLGQDEVLRALKSAGFVYKGSWKKFLQRFDKDKDGFIDYVEFCEALSECFGKEIKM